MSRLIVKKVPVGPLSAWLTQHWEGLLAGYTTIIVAAFMGLVIQDASTLLDSARNSLIALVVGVAAMSPFAIFARRQGRLAPRAWARLEVKDEKGKTRLLQYEMGTNGRPERMSIDDTRGSKRLPAREPEGISMAMSPDGSLLASVVGQTLQIWNVRPSKDAVDPWSDHPIEIDQTHENPRILAIARSGDLAVWCVYAFKPKGWPQQVRWARVEKSSADFVPIPVGNNGHQPSDEATYAAVLDVCLYYLEATDGALREVFRDHEGEPHDPFFGRIEGKVLAIDAATLGSRSLVSLLVRDEGTRTTRLIVMSPERYGNTRRAELTVKGDPKHVSLLRAPQGEVTVAFVVAAGGKVTPHYITRSKEELMLSPTRSGKPELGAGIKTRSTPPGVTE